VVGELLELLRALFTAVTVHGRRGLLRRHAGRGGDGELRLRRQRVGCGHTLVPPAGGGRERRFVLIERDGGE
jgi:hypothetical protein